MPGVGDDALGEAARSLADATAALTHSDDLAGIMARLLDDCADALGAGAVGVMVLLPDDSVEVLSASSHQALELELYQSQTADGPCLECISTGLRVSLTGAARTIQRWPSFGAALVEAGLRSVHAEPMTWQGQVIGGLNLFWTDEEPRSEQDQWLIQAFADLATVAIVHAGRVSAHEGLLHATAALASRNVIEQAKGVLAYTHNIDMGAAYELLKQQGAQSGRSLSETAAEVMHQAGQR